mmetsp:Transcript_17548/g.38261  ORF Transcript_17548/g.38261 Transcript_17548/m.38261 type:complete len:210 (+) Transcript_17548:815-1444(+)
MSERQAELAACLVQPTTTGQLLPRARWGIPRHSSMASAAVPIRDHRLADMAGANTPVYRTSAAISSSLMPLTLGGRSTQLRGYHSSQSSSAPHAPAPASPAMASSSSVAIASFPPSASAISASSTTLATSASAAASINHASIFVLAKSASFTAADSCASHMSIAPTAAQMAALLRRLTGGRLVTLCDWSTPCCSSRMMSERSASTAIEE